MRSNPLLLPVLVVGALLCPSTTLAWMAPSRSPVGLFTTSDPTMKNGAFTVSTTAMFMAGIPPPTLDDRTATSKTENDDKGNEENDPRAKMAAMMQPIREAGVAGAVSLFLWEAAFWILSVPACSIAYYQTTGSWPDWQNAEDVAKVGAEAFAFANIARFALPLRVGLAISTTPWVQKNLVDRFSGGKGEQSQAQD